MILHVDLDAFFASVEQRDRPELRGRPVLVGHPSARSVVLAASYEARPYGCRSAMPMAVARRLCPSALVVPPRGAAYAEASRGFFSILEDYTPLVEPLSIDEAFLDVTGSRRLHGPAEQIAGAIRRRVRQELGLVASVGGATVKFVAKIASDLCKPDGLRLVPAEETEAFLAPLPVERLFGVGPRTASTLRSLGLSTVGQVARFPPEALAARLGRLGPALSAMSRGLDDRSVEPDRAAVSVGAEDTFERDLTDGPRLRRQVMAQAERVAARLRRGQLQTRTVVLKLKDPAFALTTRRRTLDQPSSDGRVIAACALELLAEARVGPPGVRLVGVAATGLQAADATRQLGFDEPGRARGEKLADTLDAIRSRFGERALSRADLLPGEQEEDEG